MRHRAIFPLLASCLAVACAAGGGQGALPGLAWFFYETEEEGAKLAYGAPLSDDVVLMLSCRPHSGEVTVSAVHEDASPSIRLASARETADFVGRTDPTGFGSGVYVEADAPADHPALVRFARTGELSLRDADRSARLPVRATERARIRDFFAACRAAA